MKKGDEGEDQRKGGESKRGRRKEGGSQEEKETKTHAWKQQSQI